MTKRVIDEQEAIDTLREVVKGREGYAYNAPGKQQICRYFEPDRSPSCIVGHALVVWGYRPADELPEWNDDGLWFEAGSHPVSFTPDAAYALIAAQAAQDNGETWGEALAAAEAVARD